MKSIAQPFAILLIGILASLSSAARAAEPAAESFSNEPAAQALYAQMLETLRSATTLSWVGDYRWEVGGKALSHATYKIWLKKPDYARLEAIPAGQTEPSGILVGDGDCFWVYWPRGKPRYGWEGSGKYAEEYEQYRRTFYRQERSPARHYSIGHQTGYLGAGLAMPILDPSTFHGYTDSLQPYIDGVRRLGVETVGGDVCDVVEVSFMKHQRSWSLWLAKKDHLPRKLTQVVRVNQPVTFQELWTEVTLDASISNDRFAWSAPKDWKEWRVPELEEGLLKPGTPAPDFELTAIDGSKIKLSNFRGQIVWLNKWRCG